MPSSEFPKQSDQNGRMMRQRRNQIIANLKEDTRVKRVIKKSIANNSHSSHMMKTLLVVITALICTVVALLRYSNPNVLKRFWQEPIPTFHMATRYPPNMVLERDLPRFFRLISIATPENKMAREAVRKVLRSRIKLRQRAGILKCTLKAWDNSNVEQLLTKRICGDEFGMVYRSTNQQTKDELLMWCLLATRITEGYFKESLEIIDSPLFLTRKRGIVVLREPPAGVGEDHGALSTSFYLHPRIKDNAAINDVPSKILAMLVSSLEKGIDFGGEEGIGRLLYQLVVTDGNEKDFLILEEKCRENQPSRSVAFHTKHDDQLCFLTVPEKYGGNFNPIEDD